MEGTNIAPESPGIDGDASLLQEEVYAGGA